jgi:3-(3-hydroxy-phenyl)propionate hydroxylase
MRPAGKAPLESTYFTYPHFDPPSDRDGLSDGRSVVIVGAGPVGMVAALTLAQQGVPSVVLDDKSTFNDGSRAICVARQSFHLLEKIRAVEPFLAKALPWTKGRSYYRGQQVLEFEMPDSADEKYRPMYNIQQQYIEKYLWEAIERQSLIEVRWQSRVTAIEAGVTSSTLHVSDPLGDYELEAQWVLAADGARSSMRKACGLRLNGQNFEGRYLIADVLMPDDYPTVRRALFDPECRRGGTVLIHKQPDDLWRIDYQLTDTESEEDALDEAEVRRSVQGILKEIGYAGGWELEWWSVYSANTLALDDYRYKNVFFIGDSAHIVPIFGVRGLNNGLADGHNIGWKLARVVQGSADPRILDSYTPERRGATLDVFKNSSKSARFMTPPTEAWKLARDSALNLALTHPFAGRLANPRQMQPYTYAESDIVVRGVGGVGRVVTGGVIPDLRLSSGYLTDRLAAGFSLLCFGDRPTNAPAELTVVVIDEAEQAHSRLGVSLSTFILVRPDNHVAAILEAPSEKALGEAWKIVSGSVA